jgi:hypothetical protein
MIKERDPKYYFEQMNVAIIITAVNPTSQGTLHSSAPYISFIFCNCSRAFQIMARQ